MEILDLVSSQIVSTIGWTIVHSLWQGILISLLLSLILVFIDKKNSRLRYTISYFALIFLFTISIRTYLELDKGHRKSLEIATSDQVINSNDNLLENHEVIATPISSETEKSLFIEYGLSIQDFISTHINYIVLLWFTGIIIFSIRLLGGDILYAEIKIP